MTITTVSGGQTSSSLSVSSGDEIIVVNGGSVDNTQVLSSGTVLVSSGGNASGTVLSTTADAFATETVYAGGEADGTIADAGALLYVSSGGIASGGSSYYTPGGNYGPRAFVYSGGLLEGFLAGAGTGVFAFGGVTSDVTLLAGAVERVSSGGVASKTLLSGGTINVSSGGTATLSATSSVADTGTINVSGGGEVVISGFLMPSATISANVAGAEIDLRDIASSTVTGVTASGNTLTVSAGETTYSLAVVGAANYTSGYVSDGQGGTLLVAACYCRGTRILTDRGEQRVEALTTADAAVTASGPRRAVRWIGRRSYAGRFLAANPHVQPIRFRAGSLGEGLPRRDLLVSPEHSMFLDRVLVPARCLVNGTTIVQERGLRQVEYFHVELDSHDVLLAEGAPSESFVDDDSRGMFHNAAEWRAAYPVDERGAAVFCAPRVESGAALEAIRRRLGHVAVKFAQAA